MASFKHAYMVVSTDFDLEPVIEQYLNTYPEAQPRDYDVVCRLRNELREGDYCYIIVYEYASGRQQPSLSTFIKSYCEVHDKVAHIGRDSIFPDLAKAPFGNSGKYRKQ